MPPFAAADASLNNVEIALTDDLYGGRKASLSLNIILVGCGLGGLAAAHCLTQAGHKVTMIEAAPAIGEVGAGIQVSPNVSRLLLRWGLGPKLEQVAVRPQALVLRRYDNGETIGYTRWGNVIDREYGAPYYHIHRADFHKLLYDLAVPNLTLRLDSIVTKVDPEGPSVTLKSGEVINGDLLIGADGIKSIVQGSVVTATAPTPTGDAAYRVIIPAEHLAADPELKPLLDNPEMSGWMAPGRHLMAYPMRGKKEYNLVLLHPDNGSVESWTAEGSADRMREDFADFEPRVKKLLGFAKSTLKWQLMDRQPLERWVHPSGRVVLLGDACHPMLPYRAQGAAMAIEDGAVLGNLFSYLSHEAQIAPLLRAYQGLRHARASETQRQSRANQKIFHYEDGPEQEARDASMREATKLELRRAEREAAGLPDDTVDNTDGNANQWGDRKKSAIQYKYDADEEVNNWYSETGKDLLAAVPTWV